MEMRERGRLRPPARVRPAEPMHESIVKTIRGGSVEEKMQAIISIVGGIDRGSMSFENAQELLVEAMGDANRQVRWSAVFAMAQQGSRMIDGLRRGLGNGDPSVRGMSAAMISLCLTRDQDALRSSLGMRDEGAAETGRDLFRTLLDPQAAVRMHALGALRELARRSPVETLEELSAFSSLVHQNEGGNLELSCRLEMVRKDAFASVSGLSGKIQA